jgi:hypothetical protein
LTVTNERPCHIAIMRDIFLRGGGEQGRWVVLQDVLERIAVHNETGFRQAVDLARGKGLIAVEGNPIHRACLTNAGRQALESAR